MREDDEDKSWVERADRRRGGAEEERAGDEEEANVAKEMEEEPEAGEPSKGKHEESKEAEDERTRKRPEEEGDEAERTAKERKGKYGLKQSKVEEEPEFKEVRMAEGEGDRVGPGAALLADLLPPAGSHRVEEMKAGLLLGNRGARIQNSR